MQDYLARNQLPTGVPVTGPIPSSGPPPKTAPRPPGAPASKMGRMPTKMAPRPPSAPRTKMARRPPSGPPPKTNPPGSASPTRPLTPVNEKFYRLSPQNSDVEDDGKHSRPAVDPDEDDSDDEFIMRDPATILIDELAEEINQVVDAQTAAEVRLANIMGTIQSLDDKADELEAKLALFINTKEALLLGGELTEEGFEDVLFEVETAYNIIIDKANLLRRKWPVLQERVEKLEKYWQDLDDKRRHIRFSSITPIQIMGLNIGGVTNSLIGVNPDNEKSRVVTVNRSDLQLLASTPNPIADKKLFVNQTTADSNTSTTTPMTTKSVNMAYQTTPEDLKSARKNLFPSAPNPKRKTRLPKEQKIGLRSLGLVDTSATVVDGSVQMDSWITDLYSPISSATTSTPAANRAKQRIASMERRKAAVRNELKKLRIN